MACLKSFVCTCCDVSLCPINSHSYPNNMVDDVTDSLEFHNRMIWTHDLGTHSGGQFSHAVLMANRPVEDHSHVYTADGALFVGMYDGHGGDRTSKYLRDNLFTTFNEVALQRKSINETVLRETFERAESDFLRIVQEERYRTPLIKSVGSCCLVGVIWRGRLYIANAGDSRVVIGRKCPSGGLFAVQMTTDDNVNRASVRKELRAAHPEDNNILSFVRDSWRIRGRIQVSRSIGDEYLKHPDIQFPYGHPNRVYPPISRAVMSSVPNVHRRTLTNRDKFIIIASDGLWDKMSNARAVEIVLKNPRNGIARKIIREAVKEAAAVSRLPFGNLRRIQAPDRRRYHDDISVVVVYLDSQVTGQERAEHEPVRVTAFDEEAVLPGSFNLEGIN